MVQTQSAYEVAAREMVHRIVKQFHPEKIIAFGSLVRGQAGPDSDLDILVIMPVQGSCRQKANEIDLALADRTIPMDIIVVTPDQFDRQKNMMATIASAAALEGKVMYERYV